MIESRVSKPGVKWTALSSYAAGVTSILANIFLIALYTLQGNRPVEAAYFGTANDLVGSLEIRHLHLDSATQPVAGERDVCLDHLLDPARYRRPLGVHVPPLPHRKVAGQALEVVRVADGDLCRGGSNFGGFSLGANAGVVPIRNPLGIEGASYVYDMVMDVSIFLFVAETDQQTESRA